MKVLVIEDEPLIRDIHSEFLELLGREADVAGDGREGLPRFAEPPDERRAAQAGLRLLRKPVGFAEFQATLAEVAEHAGAAR